MSKLPQFAATAILAFGVLSVALPASAMVINPPRCPGAPSCPPPVTTPGDDDDGGNENPFDWPEFTKDPTDDSSDDDGGDDTNPKNKTNLGRNQTGDDLGVECAIKDETNLTDDMWLINTGNAALPAGTKIRYSVPATGDRGTFRLQRDIPVGKQGRLPDFISAAVQVGSECRVEISK